MTPRAYNLRASTTLWRPEDLPEMLHQWHPGSEAFAVRVRYLQSSYGLTPDGKLGPLTLAAIRARQNDDPWNDAIEGIDVSGHQKKIDGAKARAAGCRFAVVKYTEGLHYQSSHASLQALQVTTNGMLLGGYHFPGQDKKHKLPNGESITRRTFSEAASEAAAYLRYVAEVGFAPAFHALDGEGKDYRHSATETARWWLDWLLEVEKQTARVPWVYTARWAVLAFLRGADPGLLRELARFPLWWAEYRRGQKLTPPRKKLTPWREVGVHQYAGQLGDVRASHPGVKGACDRNRMRRDVYHVILAGHGG